MFTETESNHGGSGTQGVKRITRRFSETSRFSFFLQPAGSDRETAQTPLPGLAHAKLTQLPA